MKNSRFFLPSLISACLALLQACSGAVSGEEALKSAGDAARALAGKSYGKFKLLSENPVPAGKDAEPIPLVLEEGLCYRVIAVRAGSASSEEINVSFQHSEQVVEQGSDFYELTAKDGELRNKRVVWGFCVWPSLIGKLKIFSNLGPSGGYVAVLSAKAEDLSWKDGKDVKLYLKGTGNVDLKEMEKKEVEPMLRAILSKDHMNVPAALQGKAPIFYEIISTTEPQWDYKLATEPGTCYHLLLASMNCITQYKILEPGSDKVVYDDGAPDDVGRSGWIHDFCLDEKHAAAENDLNVKLKMTTDEYEHYWFAVAIYGYAAEKKEIKKVNAGVQASRKKIGAKAAQCGSSRDKCNKGCVKKEGKEKVEDEGCKFKCLKSYADCTSAIVFEGEIPSAATGPD
jgi:hypothetical protein